MGFKDIFKGKLQERQEAVRTQVEQQRSETILRSGIQAEVEPKLRALVGEVYETMREAGWSTVPVPDGTRAYVLGSMRELFPNSRAGNADVVIDSEGRIAFKHNIDVQGEWNERIALASTSLRDAHEKILARVQRTDEPSVLHTVSINSAGVLMYCECTSYDSFDCPNFTYLPLDQYLANLAARTIA
jgi:hypothetical protein